MIRAIADMPAGTLGFEAVGKVTADDYRTVLVPAVEGAIETGEVRLLFLLGEDFDSYSADAVWADMKLGAGHLRNWKRVALVSDADWLENSVKALGWLLPGTWRVFETDDLDDAREWLSRGTGSG
jgi:hypothetical protein